MSETTHNLLMVRGEHQQEISYDEPNPVITDDLQWPLEVIQTTGNLSTANSSKKHSKYHLWISILQ